MLPAAAERPARRSGRADAAERFRHHRALRALLELLARERPVALLLDDLHWADEASLEFVLHLLRRPPRAACLLVFALRPGDRGDAAAGGRARDAGLGAPAAGPLSDDAARALLAGLPDAAVRERVVARGGGQPAVPARARRALRAPGRDRAAGDADGGRRSSTSRRWSRGAGAARGRRGRRRSVRSRAGRGRRRAGARRGRARPPGRGRAGPSRDRRRARRSRSATRWCAARSTTARRRPGGWTRTSAPRPRSSGAAPAPAARAYHVARFARPGDGAAVALLTAAAEPRPPSRRRRPPRTGTRPRCGCCPTTTRAPRRAAGADGAARSRAPVACRTAARRSSRRSSCAPEPTASGSSS